MDDDSENQVQAYDPIVEEFDTYEAYLDSQITSTDMFYLEDIHRARYLVELGIRGNGEVISRQDFMERHERMQAARLARLNKKPKRLASQGKDVAGYPLLQALKDREEAVRNGKLATIIFIRDRNKRGQEVSGYIDYGARLKAGSWEAVFERRAKLLPRPGDLSFYNWDTHVATSNASPNFLVIADDESGLLFKNKRDRKVINVDPRASKPGDNSTRHELATSEHLQVVLYDHVTRRRS